MGGLLLDPALSGNVAVTGANSAVGAAVLAQIAGQDTLRAIAAVRRPEALDRLPPSPRITPCLIRYDEPDRLITALTGAECVVHLAGVLFESRTADYRTANVETTRALVEAARAAAVRHIVFVSSLGADPRSSNGYFGPRGRQSTLSPSPASTPRSSGRRYCWVRTRPPDARCCAPRRNEQSESWAAGRIGCARSTSTIWPVRSWAAASGRRPA